MAAKRSKRRATARSARPNGSAPMPATSSRAAPARTFLPDMRLLVTRPQPDGERTATELRAMGHEVTLAPLLRVEIVADAELGPGPWAGVLITSANGARAIAGHPLRADLTPLPLLAVGQASAAA